MVIVDSSVRPSKAEDSVTSAAYLLFYRRRSEHPLGGNTSILITETLAHRPPSPRDSEDSATTSPKNVADRSSSPSPPLPIPTVKPSLLNQPSIPNSADLNDIYAPLRERNATSAATSTSRIGPTIWGGGWSNRAASTHVGFTYGARSNLLTSPTGNEVKDIEDEEDEGIEIVEKVPLDLTENADDVQVFNIDSQDEPDQNA